MPLIQPDVSRFTGIFNPRSFINIDYQGNNAENGSSPIAIYNNTFLNQLTPGNRSDGLATPAALVDADADRPPAQYGPRGRCAAQHAGAVERTLYWLSGH